MYIYIYVCVCVCVCGGVFGVIPWKNTLQFLKILEKCYYYIIILLLMVFIRDTLYLSKVTLQKLHFFFPIHQKMHHGFHKNIKQHQITL